MKVLAMALGFAIAAIGIVGVADPSLLLEFGRSLQTPAALHVVSAVRIIFGVVLLWIASASRMPRTLRVVGILLIVAGLLGPFFGVERSRAMLDWWVAQGPLFTRAWASVAVIFGLFIVYVVTTPRRSAA